MGKNLVLNLVDNGYTVAAFDLEEQKINDLLTQDLAESQTEIPRIVGCSSLSVLLQRIKMPRIIILSVPAGVAVDDVSTQLIAEGIKIDDIIVDTGNSLWTDTVAREKKYKDNFTLFSSAVSGGEVGARFGPSLMPSGCHEAWLKIKPIWQAIAAKVDQKTGKPIDRTSPGQTVTNGEPCAEYIGPSGAGHYVKMVHNGIEYADMQLICEAYHVLKEGLSLSTDQIADIFEKWSDGVLNSYLLEISVEVLRHKTPEGRPLVELILDKAGQKGTGLWTVMSSLELGVPAPTIAQAVYARSLSSFKDLRIQASDMLPGPDKLVYTENEIQLFIGNLHDALYCAKICVYAQGFQLMKQAEKEHGWQLNFAGIAKIWRAGCIIRAVFLQSICLAYERDKQLDNLLLDTFFSEQLASYQMNWRKAVADISLMGVPIGALSSALSYYDAMRSAILPANLLQGQRDYFGAHTFERVDQELGKKYHVKWATQKRSLIEV
jgi:6-phosphogluconate dehydrogenase